MKNHAIFPLSQLPKTLADKAGGSAAWQENFVADHAALLKMKERSLHFA
jgi:hypothetical protein